MLLVESGQTAQKLHFLGPAGATSFTVRRKRGTNAWATMTTPTVTEDDGTSAPGAFSLLMDEDMTISSGKIFEEMAFYIIGPGGWFTLEKICLVANNLPANIKQILGTPFVAGGVDPPSPYGV